MKRVIGILTHRRLEMVTRCVETVLTQPLASTEVVIANNSVDEEYITAVEGLARAYKTGLMSFRKNRGTSAAWNALGRLYQPDQIIILNDDIRVLPGWLQAIDEVLEDPRVGVISLSLANGEEQWRSYENPPGESPSPLARYRCVYPTGCLLAMRRGTFERVGGFDENLWFGYEEVDFAIRACQLGLVNANVGVEGERYKFAVHFGSASPTTGYVPEEFLERDRNRSDYFLNKHGVPFPLPADYERLLLAIAGS